MARHPTLPAQPSSGSPSELLRVKIDRKVLADGTIKEYRRIRPPKARYQPRAADSLAALIAAYQRSKKWLTLSPHTRAMYVIYLRDLNGVGDVPAHEIKRPHIRMIRDAIAQKRGDGAAIGFIRAVSGLFTWAIRSEWEGIEANPAKDCTDDLNKGHLTPWTQEEADVAIARLPEHLRRVVVLALYTAARRGDLCAMTWADYDGESLEFIPQKTRRKTTEPLTIPCHPTLKAELDAWRETATAATILTDAQGKPWKPNLLSHYLPAALPAIGLSNELNVHGLRKLAATNLADAGCTTHEIAAITGHHTLAMVQLYTEKANRRRLGKSAIARLLDLKNGKPVDNVTPLRSARGER